MSEQMIYTSCRRGRGSAGGGIIVFSYSNGLNHDRSVELVKYLSYTKPSDLPAVIEAGHEIEYPRAFRYVSAGDNSPLMASCTYLGKDWSGTRFGSNYLGHLIFADMLEAYPIEYISSPSFLTSIDQERVSTESEPDALPSVETILLNKERPVSYEAVKEFVKKIDLDTLENLFYAVAYRGELPITLSPKRDEALLWIGALSMLFPKEYAGWLFFSTYQSENNAEYDLCIVGQDKRPSFLNQRPQKANMHISNYIKNAYSNEPLRKSLFAFMENFSDKWIRAQQFTPLFELFMIYSSEMDKLSAEEVTEAVDFFFKNSGKFSDEIRCKCSNNILLSKHSNSERISKIQTDVLVSTKDAKQKAEVEKVIDKLVLDKIKPIRDVATLEIEHSHIEPVIRRKIDKMELDDLDSPSEAYSVLMIWRAEKTPQLAKSCLEIQKHFVSDAARSKQFKEMLLSTEHNIPPILSKECPVEETYKDWIMSQIISNPGRYNFATLKRILENSLTEETGYAELLCGCSSYEKIKDLLIAYLGFRYDPDSEKTKDCVKLLIEHTRGHPEAINDIFNTLKQKADTNTAKDRALGSVIRHFNSTLRPCENTTPWELDTAKRIRTAFRHYVECGGIQKNNNIAAVVLKDSLLRGQTMEGGDWAKGRIVDCGDWSFDPTPEEREGYLRSIIGSEFRDNFKDEWFECILDLFKNNKDETALLFSVHISREVSGKERMHIIEQVVTVALEQNLKDSTVKVLLQPISNMKDRKKAALSKKVKERIKEESKQKLLDSILSIVEQPAEPGKTKSTAPHEPPKEKSETPKDPEPTEKNSLLKGLFNKKK